jgi:hypothetical protein
MRIYLILLLLILMSFESDFALAQEEARSISSRPADAFALHILDKNWAYLGLGYTSERSWPILQGNYRRMLFLNITMQEIVKYQWMKQQITLTADASYALEESFGIGPDQRPSTGSSLALRAFVVTVDDQPAYGGIFLPRGSQMAIRYPVIYVGKDSNGLITMDIRPVHSITEIDSSDQIWKVVRKDSIRDLFARTGKLAP